MKKRLKINNPAVTFITFLFVAVILFLSVKGVQGNPNDLTINSDSLKEDGPMELSPERGRFALTYTLVENKSFFFSIPVARFVLPDLGYKNGNYVSLFAPGVSFLAIPGYILGKTLGVSQVGTFLTVSLFALLNFLTLVAISQKLGFGKTAGILGALAFLFATPAFPYATTLYQHHISTFLILGSIYLLLSSSGFWSSFFVWFLLAASIPIDYPNLFLMFPLGIWAFAKNTIVTKKNKAFRFHIKYKGLLAMLGILAPLLFFLWFNQKSYGNPLQFSGTVPGVEAIDVSGKPDVPKDADLEDVEKFINPESQKKSAVNFFKTRNITNGLYIHFLSPDRGILLFAPIAVLGLLGLYYLVKKGNSAAIYLLGILTANIVLYSMWGDPWGGWGFGSRYLVPGYSILGIGVSSFLYENRKKILYIIIFIILFAYSAFINTAGALTTSAIPPKIQVLVLESITKRVEHYNYMRGIEHLNDNRSKSFVFESLAGKRMSAWNYFYLIYSLIMFLTLVNLGTLVYGKDEKQQK